MESARDITGKPLPKFYLTQAAPCPYLPGKMERKLFTHLHGSQPDIHHTHLSKLGFRRSQNVAWRPACDSCSACQSLRVRAQDFVPSRSQQRVLKHAQCMTTRIVPLRAQKNHFALLKHYLHIRHPGGDMADMSYADYRSMLTHGTVTTQLLECTKLISGKRQLCGVVLRDCLSDGVSLVYAFYDPNEALSLGSYMILQQIMSAQKQGLAYVYLGYWIATCRKMVYKTRFAPYELYGPQGWQRHDS